MKRRDVCSLRAIRRSFHYISHGFAVDQLSGVGVLRVGKHRLHRTLLNDAAGLHHGDAVGELAHQIQIVRDQQHRHAMLALQHGEQIEDLHTHRHVERRGGLVCQQQGGLAGQRHGDHGALSLPA